MVRTLWVLSLIETSTVLANGLANSITAATVRDPKEVNQVQNNVDRRIDAAGAETTSRQGNATAIATGSSLLATGIPMLASPIPSVQAAGAILVARAGMEFAQAAVDRRAAVKNQDQKNLLANGQGLTGSTARGESKTNPALTGQLESFLKDRGVNPEEFAGKLSRGEFNNPADVLSAIGNSGEISSEDLVEAEQLADQQTSTIVGSNVGEPPEEETLQLKEAENSSPLQAQGQILNGNFGTSELAQSSKEQAAGDVRRPASISGETEPKSELAGSSALAGATNGLHALMDALRRGDLAGAEEVLRKLELLKDSGVQQVRGNDTIFSLARRLYKGFGKWRRGPKFARK